jgi:hypothetical protein
MYKKRCFSVAKERRKCTNAIFIVPHPFLLAHQFKDLVRSVNLTNSAKAVSRVELVLTRADHEPRVTLDLVGRVEVGHALLEEGSGLLLGSASGVETEFGDPDGLSVESSGLLDLGLEAVDGG